MNRPTWDEYFLDIAEAVSRRSTCDRAHVGAVIIDTETKRILATGYNGARSHDTQCDEAGHLMVGGHCRRTVHAEINAIVQLDELFDPKRQTLYCTHKPCDTCVHALRGMPYVYREEYP